MTWWTLSPRDSLLARDGRPFGIDSSARTMSFPLPSVTAGAIRTRIGFAVGKKGEFGLSADKARQIPIEGPVLVRISDQVSFFPTPADCLFLNDPQAAKNNEPPKRYRLKPTPIPTGLKLERNSLESNLLPFNGDLGKGKPDRSAPVFWSASALEAWLHHPPDSPDTMERADGLGPLLTDYRVHVSIDPRTGTGLDGKLFGTEALCFRVPLSTEGEVYPTIEPFGLLLHVEDPRLQPGLQPLGGERRLALISKADHPILPQAPPQPTRRMRVVLLSPAWFDNGAYPRTIEGAKVLCHAVGRAQVVSGWDMEERAPKPTRRLAPAGSVYWVELPENLDPNTWVERVHLHCISDDEQARRDGFGLAAVGTWSHT